MSEAEDGVYMLSVQDIKSEPVTDSEEEVGCRLCCKVFGNNRALENHVKISHVDAYVTGDPKTWTDDSMDSTKAPKKLKLDPKAIKIAQQFVSMKSNIVRTVTSDNVSYIIIKTEDLLEERKRKKPQKKEKAEVKVKRPEPKEPDAITGPFECLEPSTFGSDGVCHQMFFSCCEYSEHQLTEHTRPRRRTARCQVCERPLSQLHQNGPKDFTCEKCSEGFDSVDELVEHKNQFHLQNKRFSCSVCGKRFSAQGGVVQHMRMHTGDRPYKCTICDKAFTQKSGLEQHIRTHTKVKPFRCVICSKTFIQTVHLRQHMRTHTNVAPFQCVICEKRFKQSSHLNYHLKNHPAKMTDEQKEKYREIIEKIQKNTERSSSLERETMQAEQSIKEEGVYEIPGKYAFVDEDDSPKVITQVTLT